MRDVVVALDCMGGEHAPHAVLSGASKVLSSNNNIKVLLVGDEAMVRAAMEEVGVSAELREGSSIIHAGGIIKEDTRPAVALRQSKGTSMRVAIEQVANGRASCVVSAGNTGALMAISMAVIRTLDCLSRPAIAVIMPSASGRQVVMLDAGANIVCTSDLLAQFAVVGNAWSKVLYNVAEPEVSLLNIGSEESKGGDVIRGAARILKAMPLNFVGYTEPDDLMSGCCDVVVCDGLMGNVALKASEGAVSFFQERMRVAFGRSLYSRIVGKFASGVLRPELEVVRARCNAGGVLVGLNGVVIKAHGAARADSWVGAIERAAYIAIRDPNSVIISDMAIMGDMLEDARE